MYQGYYSIYNILELVGGPPCTSFFWYVFTDSPKPPESPEWFVDLRQVSATPTLCWQVFGGRMPGGKYETRVFEGGFQGGREPGTLFLFWTDGWICFSTWNNMKVPGVGGIWSEFDSNIYERCLTCVMKALQIYMIQCNILAVTLHAH